MTEAEFLEWQRHQEQRYELVDGVPRAMTGARFRHDRGLVNAFGTLLDALEAIDSPCRPFTADIAVRVPTGDLRRPDVAVYCPLFDEDAMVSNRPRLVVEVLSESTEDTDQHVKVDEYQHMDAVVPLPLFGVSLSLARLYRSVELRPRPHLVSEG